MPANSTLYFYWPANGLARPSNQLITGDAKLDAKVLAAMRAATLWDGGRLARSHVRELLTRSFRTMHEHRTARRCRSKGEFWHAVTRAAGWTMVIGPTGVRILLLACIRQLRAHGPTPRRRDGDLVGTIRAMSDWMELDGDDEVDAQASEDAERPADADGEDERDFDTMDEDLSLQGLFSP